MRTHLSIEAIAVHAEVEGRVAEADNARLDFQLFFWFSIMGGPISNNIHERRLTRLSFDRDEAGHFKPMQGPVLRVPIQAEFAGIDIAQRDLVRLPMFGGVPNCQAGMERLSGQLRRSREP